MKAFAHLYGLSLWRSPALILDPFWSSTQRSAPELLVVIDDVMPPSTLVNLQPKSVMASLLAADLPF